MGLKSSLSLPSSDTATCLAWTTTSGGLLPYPEDTITVGCMSVTVMLSKLNLKELSSWQLLHVYSSDCGWPVGLNMERKSDCSSLGEKGFHHPTLWVAVHWNSGWWMALGSPGKWRSQGRMGMAHSLLLCWGVSACIIWVDHHSWCLSLGNKKKKDIRFTSGPCRDYQMINTLCVESKQTYSQICNMHGLQGTKFNRLCLTRERNMKNVHSKHLSNIWHYIEKN